MQYGKYIHKWDAQQNILHLLNFEKLDNFLMTINLNNPFLPEFGRRKSKQEFLVITNKIKTYSKNIEKSKKSKEIIS